MHIDFQAFIQSLTVMARGMLSIFFVMAIIMGSIFVMNKLGSKAK